MPQEVDDNVEDIEQADNDTEIMNMSDDDFMKINEEDYTTNDTPEPTEPTTEDESGSEQSNINPNRTNTNETINKNEENTVAPDAEPEVNDDYREKDISLDDIEDDNDIC